MTDKEQVQTERPDRDDEAMARLLRLAGPRSDVPTAVQARVYERVRSEWQAATSTPDDSNAYRRVHRAWAMRTARARMRRWAMPVALAASVLVAIGVVMQPAQVPMPAPAAVGTVARVVDGGRSGALPGAGDAVYAEQTLRTGSDQGLSLLLNNSASLRLDQNTTLVVDADHRFTLERGRLYADTGEFIYRDDALIIDTALGTVTDIGTRFAVESGGGLLEVAVRDGRVDVNRDSREYIALAGERMRLRRDGEVVTDNLAPHDDYWDWATSLAPQFDIENKSLLDFLNWVARETGRELVFESNDLRMAAMRTDLHGSVAGLAPAEAVDAVLATTRFRYRMERSRIVIEQ